MNPQDVIIAIGSLLTAWGFAVPAAATGRQALAVAALVVVVPVFGLAYLPRVAPWLFPDVSNLPHTCGQVLPVDKCGPVSKR